METTEHLGELIAHDLIDSIQYREAYLYHYTRSDALFNILKNWTLRATDSRFLNDSSEVEFGRDLFLAACLQRRDADPRERDFWDDLIANLRHGERPQTFIISFSDNDDLLSMWRGYGAVQDRYCIHFSNLFLRPKYGGPFEKGNILRVVYEEDEHRRTVGIVMKNIAHLLDHRLKYEREKLPELATAAAEWIQFLLPVFKHPAFREEREVRAIFHSRFIENTILFRPGAGHIVPYIEFKLAQGEQSSSVWPMIEEIRIGPMTQDNRKLARVGLKEFLASLELNNNPNIHITDSHIPFRE